MRIYECSGSNAFLPHILAIAMNFYRSIWIIGWLLMAGSHAAHGQGGSWTPIATNGAPSPRCFHTAIWTGSEMIIWGGRSNSTYLNTGARYHPVSNTWTAIMLDHFHLHPSLATIDR